MRIDKLNADVVRSDVTRELRRDEENPNAEVVEPGQEVARVDRVEISDAGRALAAEAEATQESIQPEKVREFRQMVVGGKYDRPEVIAEVARRMEASGDLRQDLALDSE